MRCRCTDNHRDSKALEARRMEAAQLFREAFSRAEVARLLGVSDMSASRWYRRWEAQGEAGLHSTGNPGPPPRLSAEQRQELEAALLAGPMAAGYTTDLWTVPRVRRLIQERFGVHYHVSHVWLLLRQLGFSWHKPGPQAKERDDAAVARWRRETWPRAKRGHGAVAPRSSSGMKRASHSVPR